MFYKRAKELMDWGLSDALEAVNESLELNSKHVEPMLARATILWRLGRRQLAYQ